MDRFSHLLQLIKSGEPVTPGTANRSPEQLKGDINALWQIIQAAEIGSTVYARRVTVETDAQQGMPVYYNKTRQRYERGLAKLDTTPSSGQLQTAEDAKIWGIVAYKHNATLADVLLFGYAAIDISAAVVGPTVEAGTYYLSGTTPGKLVKTPYAVSVPVLESDGNGNVYVRTQLLDIVNRHTHYKFPLPCKPAGSTVPPTIGERHTISESDETKTGWLPASHAIFDGKAPAGAVFGYNLSAHEALKNAWPPLPTSNAWIEWNKAIDKDVGFTGVPLGADGLCIVDRYGLWWMSDCYGDVPWPISYSTESSESDSSSVSVECPRDNSMEMLVFFTKAEFATDVLVVRSLRSRDERIIVRCIDGATGGSGDLEILLDLNLVSSEGVRGYQFFKEFDGNTFGRGPGVEGIWTTSENVTITGDAESLVDTTDTAGPKMKHGKVRIEVSQYPTRELPVSLVDVRGGVEEQHVENLNYLGLPTGQASWYRGRIKVPADATLQDPQLQLRFLILGRAAGDLPSLTLTARRVLRPTDDPLDLPDDTDEFSVTIDTTATLDDNNQYVEVTATAFAVAAGDVIFFTLARGADDDYEAEVGILDQAGILSAA